MISRALFQEEKIPWALELCLEILIHLPKPCNYKPLLASLISAVYLKCLKNNGHIIIEEVLKCSKYK